MAGFPTQDSVHTESLSVVPRATDGSGFASSMVIFVGQPKRPRFLLPCSVIFPPDRWISSLTLSYSGLSQTTFAGFI